MVVRNFRQACIEALRRSSSSSAEGSLLRFGQTRDCSPPCSHTQHDREGLQLALLTDSCLFCLRKRRGSLPTIVDLAVVSAHRSLLIAIVVGLCTFAVCSDGLRLKSYQIRMSQFLGMQQLIKTRMASVSAYTKGHRLNGWLEPSFYLHASMMFKPVQGHVRAILSKSL